MTIKNQIEALRQSMLDTAHRDASVVTEVGHVLSTIEEARRVGFNHLANVFQHHAKALGAPQPLTSTDAPPVSPPRQQQHLDHLGHIDGLDDIYQNADYSGPDGMRRADEVARRFAPKVGPNAAVPDGQFTVPPPGWRG